MRWDCILVFIFVVGLSMLDNSNDKRRDAEFDKLSVRVQTIEKRLFFGEPAVRKPNHYFGGPKRPRR